MKNKILIIFLLIITLISFATISFCSYDFDYDEYTIKLPDIFNDYEYWFVGFQLNSSDSSHTLTLFLSDSPFSTFYDNTQRLSCDTDYYYSGSSRSEKNENGSVILDYSSLEFAKCSPSDHLQPIQDGWIYFSSHDIKNEDGEVVFHLAPLDQVEPMTIQQVEEIPPMITKLVTIILPVILVIMGIFLVIYIIRYKIFSRL